MTNTVVVGTMMLPMWIRYAWEILKQVIDFLGPVFSIVNVLIPPLAAGVTWFIAKFGVELPTRIALTVAVFTVSITTTVWVDYRLRTQIGQESVSRSEEAFQVANKDFEDYKKISGTDSDAQYARTVALMDMDQAIAKISSHIFLVVYYRFPELHVRSISVHMLRPVTSEQKSGEVLNLVQEGRDRKDFAKLPLSGSLVGYAMQQSQGSYEYCPDVETPSPGFEACSHFTRAPNAVPDYSSLLCYPLGEASSEAKDIGGICFDSRTVHAFDGEENLLIRTLTPQLNHLSDLLDDYRDLLLAELNAEQAEKGLPAWMPAD